MASTDCTHSWETCPVHGTGTDDLPDFKTVLVCLYGGTPTKDGGTFGEEHAKAVLNRVREAL